MKQKTFLDAVNDSTAKMYWHLLKPYLIGIMIIVSVLLIGIVYTQSEFSWDKMKSFVLEYDAQIISALGIILVFVYILLIHKSIYLKQSVSETPEPDEYDNFSLDQEI